MNDIHIRCIMRRDMPEVMEIEQLAHRYPWPEKDFLDYLKNRSVIAFVAEFKDQVVGFMVYELLPKSLELSNIAVHPACQRRGVGFRLIEILRGKLTKERRQRIDVVVHDLNLEAQLFFRACGFKAQKVLHQFYSNTDDDAYLMRLRYNSKVPESNSMQTGDRHG